MVLAARWTTAPAHAQWVITPYVGVNIARDVEKSKRGPGLSVGYLGDQFGFEFDLQRYQHFFKDSRVFPLDPAAPANWTGGTRNACIDINTRAIGFMGNVVVPIRSQRGSDWRPYGTAGLGVIRGWTNEPKIDRHQNNLGFNAGSGLIYSLRRRVGLRVDLRYFRVLVDKNQSDNIYHEDYGFWRLTMGVTSSPHDSCWIATLHVFAHSEGLHGSDMRGSFRRRRGPRRPSTVQPGRASLRSAALKLLS